MRAALAHESRFSGVKGAITGVGRISVSSVREHKEYKHTPIL